MLKTNSNTSLIQLLHRSILQLIFSTSLECHHSILITGHNDLSNRGISSVDPSRLETLLSRDLRRPVHNPPYLWPRGEAPFLKNTKKEGGIAGLVPFSSTALRELSHLVNSSHLGSSAVCVWGINIGLFFEDALKWTSTEDFSFCVVICVIMYQDRRFVS